MKIECLFKKRWIEDSLILGVESTSFNTVSTNSSVVLLKNLRKRFIY